MPLTADATKANAATYRQVEFPLFRGEERIFERFLRSGMRVLDLGCGSGRVTRPLMARGVRVIGADLMAAPLRQIHNVSDASARAIPLLQSDAMAMPFADGAFDAVVFSFNGLDMIVPEEGRLEALRECARVTGAGGHLIFSSHNRWGALLSPPGFVGVRRIKRRWRFLRGGEFRSRYQIHGGGKHRYYQASPHEVIEQVRTNTGMELVFACSSRTGWSLRVPGVRMLSEWPYYVFRNA